MSEPGRRDESSPDTLWPAIPHEIRNPGISRHRKEILDVRIDGSIRAITVLFSVAIVYFLHFQVK